MHSFLSRCRPGRYGVALVAVSVMVAAAPAMAADQATFSADDQAFVAMVSQGGMFEVEASKLAVQKAQAQDVKDQGATEVHDHQLVGARLKTIADAHGDHFSTTLNADFQGRLDHLNSLSGTAFDAAYLQDMARVHALDGAAFANESKTGQDWALVAFAGETVRIVERHIGSLHGTDAGVRQW